MPLPARTISSLLIGCDTDTLSDFESATSPGDVQAILTDKPARIYGFDIEKLQPVTDRVGPSTQELVGSV